MTFDYIMQIIFVYMGGGELNITKNLPEILKAEKIIEYSWIWVYISLGLIIFALIIRMFMSSSFINCFCPGRYPEGYMSSDHTGNNLPDILKSINI